MHREAAESMDRCMQCSSGNYHVRLLSSRGRENVRGSRHRGIRPTTVPPDCSRKGFTGLAGPGSAFALFGRVPPADVPGNTFVASTTCRHEHTLNRHFRMTSGHITSPRSHRPSARYVKSVARRHHVQPCSPIHRHSIIYNNIISIPISSYLLRLARSTEQTNSSSAFYNTSTDGIRPAVNDVDNISAQQYIFTTFDWPLPNVSWSWMQRNV